MNNMLRILTFLYLFVYAIYSTVGFVLDGLLSIKWHTHLMLYVYIIFILFFIYNSFKKYINTNYFTILISIVFGLFILEIIMLTCFDRYKTYTEKVSNAYLSQYKPLFNNYYHNYPPNQTNLPYQTNEFIFYRDINSNGFVDIEFKDTVTEDKACIICLGDSFTEGVGATFDSSYPANLRRKLPDNWIVMNGGIAASDPFFNYYSLKDIFIKYEPKIIIQTLSYNDISSDIRIRGGFNRFKNDGSVEYDKKPFLDALYGVSSVSRIIFQILGYDQTLLKYEIDIHEKKKIDSTVIDLFYEYEKLANKNNFIVYIVLYPTEYEIENRNYEYDYKTILKEIKKYKHLKVIELFDCYNEYASLRKNDLSYFYWKFDRHHNGRGYEMMAHCIYEQLKMDIVRIQNKNSKL